jgi:hypothetical protein
MSQDTSHCRICYGEEGELVSPCQCKGSIGYVHSDCQVEYMKISGNASKRCTTCNTVMNNVRGDPRMTMVLKYISFFIFFSLWHYTTVIIPRSSSVKEICGEVLVPEGYSEKWTLFCMFALFMLIVKYSAEFGTVFASVRYSCGKVVSLLSISECSYEISGLMAQFSIPNRIPRGDCYKQVLISTVFVLVQALFKLAIRFAIDHIILKDDAINTPVRFVNLKSTQ